jgi:diguanylate cyclase (GGDEF)-like protein/PAS domain S-box-containing protein
VTPPAPGLLDGEESTLRAAEDLLASGLLGAGSEPFGQLAGQYGRLLRHVRSLIKVSDRMQIELNHLNDRLSKSEVKYRSLFNNVSEGIFIAQLSGRFLDVNPAMARTLGYGTPLEFLRVHEEDELWPFLDESEKERFIANLAEHGNATRLQTRMLHKDGSIIWVEINAHAHSDDRSAPIMIVEGILSDITERKRMVDELRYLATTDGLTGLLNRRHFLELCEHELQRRRRSDQHMGLLMLDADHFKRINDSYGHDIGDEVLRALSRLCRKQFREGDLIGRLGGEEFAILLPSSSPETTQDVAERLRMSIEQTHLPMPDGTMLRFTVSIGICTLPASQVAIGALLKLADQALYAAKRSGRNRVVAHLAE